MNGYVPPQLPKQTDRPPPVVEWTRQAAHISLRVPPLGVAGGEFMRPPQIGCVVALCLLFHMCLELATRVHTVPIAPEWAGWGLQENDFWLYDTRDVARLAA